MNVLASKGQLRASLLRWSLVLVPGTVLLGFLSSTLVGGGPGDPWFDALQKPGIFPPPATFGIVWTILYAMIGFAMALICAAWGAAGRGIAIVLWLIQLAINLTWTPVFFGAHQITGALVVIAVLSVAVLATTIQFFRVRKLAGWLMVPYLAWVLFATVLNYQFLALNPDADGKAGPAAVERVRI